MISFTRTHATMATAALATLLTAGTVASAQAASPPAGKMSQGLGGMKEMKGMSGMMRGTHHALAMAYRDNMATFARALRSEVARTSVVDVDLARPASAEMRRSFDQMRDQHQAHMKTMGDQPDAKMTAMSKQMDAHTAALGAHLTALESEVNTRTPDAKNVMEHAGEIVKACGAMPGMSGMSGKGAPHKM